jgi:large subunit ribosomal protein L13
MSTYFPSAGEVQKKWYLVDAEGQVLGRLAARVAPILMGKHKPQYTPFLDTGDHVIVVNAAKVRLTGQKLDKKIYRHYTGYPGGLVERRARQVKAVRPARMVEEAIRGMLPKTKLGKAMARKLRVYAGPQHRHDAQKPEQVRLEAPGFGSRHDPKV